MPTLYWGPWLAKIRQGIELRLKVQHFKFRIWADRFGQISQYECQKHKRLMNSVFKNSNKNKHFPFFSSCPIYFLTFPACF